MIVGILSVGDFLLRIYFAVNLDGTEIASNERLIRVEDVISSDVYSYSFETYEKYNNGDRFWVVETKSENTGKFGSYRSKPVILPKGTIHKITGLSISYEDNPIEVEL